ncbi:hypothetical protein J9Z47_003551 [Salmonella enterica]|nr:hypothetical protein [Salmonella enterica]
MKNNNSVSVVKFDQAEATSDGISLIRITEAGWHAHIRLVGYKTALRWLDDGVFDRETASGLRFAAALMDGEAHGYFRPDNEQKAVFWRWLVAVIFINEQREKNGVVKVPNGEGGADLATIYSGEKGALTVYPSGVRLSLATHVEGLSIERFGRVEGLKLALKMYMTMLTIRDGDFCLSATGQEGFSILYDDYIEMLEAEGIPDAPVMH